jgi:hypothetical protein
MHAAAEEAALAQRHSINPLKKVEQQAAARRLRSEEGMSVGRTATEVGAAQSSVSTWVRDIELTEDQKQALKAGQRLTRRAAAHNRKRARPEVSLPTPTLLGTAFLRFGPAQHGHGYHPTKTKGDIAEAAAIAFFVEAGFDVSRPTSENCRYDFVADDRERLARVRVKHAHVEAAGSVKFQTSSHSPYCSRGYTAADCDFFAAWCADLGILYVISQAAVGTQESVTLRLYPGERHPHPDRIRWARDYEFAGVLPWPETT